MTTRQRRRRKVKRILLRRHRYQFGQPRRTTRLVGGGTVACTDTCIQLIVLMATGKRVSLDLIRRRSGGPRDGSRGLRPEESVRALASFGLDYAILDHFSPRRLLRIAADKGPLILAERYWSHPQWDGYRYLGRTLHGWASDDRGRSRHVGTSDPRGRSGLTQWTFRDGHAVLLATAILRTDGGSVGLVRDPNHNSSSRPERPAWDRVTEHQLRTMADSIRPAYGGRRLAIVPRRAII